MSWNSNSKLRSLVLAAILSALSFVLMRFVEFPIFASAPFLKTDLGDIPLLFGAIILGPVYGVGIALVKNLLYLISGAGSGGPLGVLVNFIALASFAIVTGLLTYRKKKPLIIFLGLILGGLALTFVMIPTNLWAVPLFLPGISRKDLLDYIFKINIPFNLIKGVIDTVIVFAVWLMLRKRGFAE